MAIYGKYNMLVDVYQQVDTIMPSGQRLREWDYDNPSAAGVPCQARGFESAGLRNVGSTERYEGSTFDDVEWVRVRMQLPLGKGARIGNIRTVNRWGEVTVHWKSIDHEDDLLEAEGDPEVFDVQGVRATQDPWSHLVEYEVLAKKVDD